MSHPLFIDCMFSHCDLSLVNLAKTCFRDVFAEPFLFLPGQTEKDGF